MRTLLLTAFALSLAACSSCDEKKPEDPAAAVAPATAPANPQVVATPDMMNQMNRMVRPGTDPKRQRLFPARRIVRLDPNQMNQTPNLPPPGAGDGPAPEQVPPAPAPQPAPQR